MCKKKCLYKSTLEFLPNIYNNYFNLPCTLVGLLVHDSVQREFWGSKQNNNDHKTPHVFIY